MGPSSVPVLCNTGINVSRFCFEEGEPRAKHCRLRAAPPVRGRHTGLDHPKSSLMENNGVLPGPSEQDFEAIQGAIKPEPSSTV